MAPFVLAIVALLCCRATARSRSRERLAGRGEAPVEAASPLASPRSPSRLDQGDRVRAVVIVVLLASSSDRAPDLLSAYWVKIPTAVAIYTIVCLGLGLLMGRVGLVSLGQVAVLAIGPGWGALLFATGVPFPWCMIMTG